MNASAIEDAVSSDMEPTGIGVHQLAAQQDRSPEGSISVRGLRAVHGLHGTWTAKAVYMLTHPTDCAYVKTLADQTGIDVPSAWVYRHTSPMKREAIRERLWLACFRRHEAEVRKSRLGLSTGGRFIR